MSCHILSCHVTSSYITKLNAISSSPCHIMPHYVTSCHLTSQNIMQHHATPCCITSCHIMSHHVMSHHVTSHQASLCHVSRVSLVNEGTCQIRYNLVQAKSMSKLYMRIINVGLGSIEHLDFDTKSIYKMVKRYYMICWGLNYKVFSAVINTRA